MEEAIALTWKTMNTRLRNLRAGAIVSLSSVIAILILAFAYRSWGLLVGLPFIILLGTLFILREQRILFAWENRVLALWSSSDLCMGIFVQTLANHPHALKASLKSMVAPLPENPDYIVPPEDHLKTYRWLFWTRSLGQEIRFYRAAAFNFVLACVPFALWYVSGEGWPWILIGLSPICALPVVEGFLTHAALWRWERRVKTLGGWNPESLPGFDARVQAIDWSRIPARLQKSIRSRIPARASITPA
ncbi:MAG: hypothetical protein M3Y08_08080 [Fibrobacterota bacterium]|nr:hypothetical protein [Fibrobacterota bacterium]